RADARELLPRLARKPGDGGVVEVFRQSHRLEVLRALDGFELAIDVAGVLDFDLRLKRDVQGCIFETGRELAQLGEADLRPLEQLRERRSASNRGGAQRFDLAALFLWPYRGLLYYPKQSRGPVAFALQAVIGFLPRRADLMADLGEA